MEFTVKRSEWYRGKGPEESYLLQRNGKKCCVGFYCLAAGIAPEKILDVPTTQLLSNDDAQVLPPWSAARLSTELGNLPDIFMAYKTNDSSILSDEEREAELKKIFERNGDTILFVD